MKRTASLIRLLDGNIDWLVDRIMTYAEANSFQRYTVLRRETRKNTVKGLVNAIRKGIRYFGGIPDLKSPELCKKDDPLSLFGVQEAQRHQKRNILLPTIMGIVKYYRQSFLDLLSLKADNLPDKDDYRVILQRCFDRIEIALCDEWAHISKDELINRFRAIIDNTEDAVIGKNLDGVVTSWNLGAEELYGYQAEEMLGQPVSRLVPFGVPNEIPKILNKIKSGQKVERYETQRIRKDGKIIQVSLSISPVKDSEGNIIEASSIARDITVRKKAEKELIKTWRMWDAILAAALDSVMVIEPDGTILDANEALARWMNINLSDLIGKCAYKLIPEDVVEKRKAKIDYVIHNKEPVRFEEQRGEVYVDQKIYPVLDEDGNVAQLVVFVADITHRKRVEKELRHAREEAEAASEAKSRFLSTMSHEIRTPLNAIMGMAGVLVETPLNDEQQNYVRFLNSAGNDLLGIIHNTLDLSKIEAGKLELECIFFNPAEIVNRVCRSLSLRAKTKGIQLVMEIKPEADVLLLGDPYRIGQVLVNLVANAVKFTENGSVVVKAFVKNDNNVNNQDQVELVFSVCDSGIGIPKEKHQIIFDRYSQVDSSTTRKYGGTGLGLSISRQLVTLMGGEITVSSTPGQGSCFTFNALFKRSEERRKEEPRPHHDYLASWMDYCDKNPDPQRQPFRILLAEDSHYNRMVVEAFLKDLPIEIDAVENGVLALDKFKHHRYRLVLMDIQMPKMDGLTATTEIRKWEKEMNLSPTPIIAVTAHALADDAAKCLDAGCSNYMSKPINKENLLCLIGEYLEEIRLPDRSPEKTENQPDSHATKETQQTDVEKVRVTVDPVLKPHVPVFLEEVAQNAVEILEQLEKNNFEDIRMLGHKLKGDSGTFGFHKLWELGRLIQEAAENRKSEIVKALVVQLEDHLKTIDWED